MSVQVYELTVDILFWCYRSYEPPKRDEETEMLRKVRAKRARETRRSTQVSTLQYAVCNNITFMMMEIFNKCTFPLLNEDAFFSWVVRAIAELLTAVLYLNGNKEHLCEKACQLAHSSFVILRRCSNTGTLDVFHQHLKVEKLIWHILYWCDLKSWQNKQNLLYEWRYWQGFEE